MSMDRLAAGVVIVALSLQAPSLAQDEQQLKAVFDKGAALRKQGRIGDAIPFFEQAAAMATKVFGPDDLTTAAILGNAAQANYLSSRFREAEQQYRKILAIREAKLPKDDLRIASTLSDLGITLNQLGQYVEAEKLLGRCLAMQQDDPPKNVDLLRATLSNVGSNLHALGRYESAEKQYKRALQLVEQLEGKDSMTAAGLLHNLSDLYRLMGRFDDAETFTRRSLAIKESKLGPGHPGTADNLSQLGMIAFDLGRVEDAIRHHQRVAEMREKQFGSDHPTVATALVNLALAYGSSGRTGEAELHYRRALAIREEALGRDHPQIASVLVNYGVQVSTLGRHDEAEKLFARALKIQEAKLGPEHPDLISPLNSMAGLHQQQGRPQLAEKLYRRSLAIAEKHLGKDHLQVSLLLNNLGLLAVSRRQFGVAEPMLRRSLAMNEKQVGPDHPRLIANLANLGQIRWHSGDPAEAELYYRRALRIASSQGATGGDVVIMQRILAQLRQAQGESAEAIQLYEQSLQGHLGELRSVFAYSTESAMQSFMHMNESTIPLLFTLTVARNDDAAAEAALTWTLRLKGAVFDTLCRYRQAQNLLVQDAGWKEKWARYRSQKEFLANAALKASASDERGKKRLAEAEAEVEELEKELNRTLARKSPELFAERESVTIDQVRKRLPADGALVEFVQAPLRNVKAPAWGAPHYFAIVLTPRAAPKLIDLGPAKELDAGVESLRKNFADFQEKLRECESADEVRDLEKAQEKEFVKASAALYARLFAPLRAALGEATLLYLAADGALNRLPFETLVDAEGKYLIERYRCAYLSSGRDLLRQPGKSAEGTVVFAGPNYKLEPAERLAQADRLLKKKDMVALARSPAHELRSVGWRPLPGAAAEAKDIQAILHKGRHGPVKTYVGSEAIEEVLKAMPPPRILHLATHGYFLDREPASAEDDEGASPRSRLKQVENPLLRSGIILAGANVPLDKDAPERVDDGWVTAEEIALLNLTGTELVVLSACQTGLGDIKSGEGVYGLRRAFLHAGARTLVTSLFEVPDTETRELMKRFYGGLAEGHGHLRALHSAQRAFLAERRQKQSAAHPFFWASFVLVGQAE